MMNDSAQGLGSPTTDPTPIFELYRGSFGSELLTAAVAHFDVFGRLAAHPLTLAELRNVLGLDERPALVLTTAIRAMGLVELDSHHRLQLTPLGAEHLVPDSEFDVGDYIGLSANSPGVLDMVDRLRSNRPAGLDPGEQGAAFIYRAGVASAMEEAELARHFTLALAGRAKNVAPALAERVSLATAQVLLDVGGGTGIYSIAFLRRNPNLRAIVLDRPEVLNTAREFAAHYQIADRIEFLAADMFSDVMPSADVVLLSNILHDWDVDACRDLISRCVQSLDDRGRLVIHDVLLDDDLGGPLPIALYSAALFRLTEGRAYAAREFTEWMTEAGMQVAAPQSTLVHCHAIIGTK